MPWTTPRTWVAAETVTALIMNTHIRDNLNILKTNINDDGSINVSNQLVQGRLTLTASTPVTTSDVTAATTLRFTPFTGQGNSILLYDGTNWVLTTLSELTIGTGGLSASTIYDVFCDYNAGSPQLVLVAWSSDTARATALATQDGIYVRSGNTDHLFVGCVRTNSSTQFEDSAANRWVWNMYNRVPRALRLLEATDSWTYTTDTIRQANNSTSNQVDVLVGNVGVPIQVSVVSYSENGLRARRSTYIGEDSTTAPVTGSTIGGNEGLEVEEASAHYNGYVPLGRHFYAWLERSDASSTTTWYGDGGGTSLQSGIQGWIEA